MKINVGDTVTLKPMKVLKTAQFGGQRICVDAPGYADGFWLDADDIASVEPAPLKVGDRVKMMCHPPMYYEGKLLGIEGDMAWVKFEEPTSWVPHLFHDFQTVKISSLTRIGGK